MPGVHQFIWIKEGKRSSKIERDTKESSTIAEKIEILYRCWKHLQLVPKEGDNWRDGVGPSFPSHTLTRTLCCIAPKVARAKSSWWYGLVPPYMDIPVRGCSVHDSQHIIFFTCKRWTDFVHGNVSFSSNSCSYPFSILEKVCIWDHSSCSYWGYGCPVAICVSWGLCFCR